LTPTQFYQAGKITAAVCHGPAGLVGVTDAEGKSIFAGKAATGFSNAEETQAGKVKVGELHRPLARADLGIRTFRSSLKIRSSASVASTRKLPTPGQYVHASSQWCNIDD
jgi:putative intracellular protease/amidase